jgi:hypothetical protein
MAAVAVVANTVSASERERLREAMAFDAGQRIRLLMPRARQTKGHGVEMESFAMSPEIRPEQGGRYWALMQDVLLPGLSEETRVSDAVAVAALQAAGANRRRAVLLVLGDSHEDESRHSARAVRGLLESLNVPLHVWRFEPGEQKGGNVAAEWGEGESIGSFRELQKAAQKLSKSLDRQRIVWVEGSYLPSQVAVASAARVEGFAGR